MKEFLIALVIVLVFAFPLLVIYSLNVLFAFSIPYTFQTWFCICILIVAFGITAKRSQ